MYKVFCISQNGLERYIATLLNSYTHIGRIKQAVLCVSYFSIPLAKSLCGSYLSYSHRSHTGSIVLLD